MSRKAGSSQIGSPKGSKIITTPAMMKGSAAPFQKGEECYYAHPDCYQSNQLTVGQVSQT